MSLSQPFPTRSLGCFWPWFEVCGGQEWFSDVFGYADFHSSDAVRTYHHICMVPVLMRTAKHGLEPSKQLGNFRDYDALKSCHFPISHHQFFPHHHFFPAFPSFPARFVLQLQPSNSREENHCRRRMYAEVRENHMRLALVRDLAFGWRRKELLKVRRLGWDMMGCHVLYIYILYNIQYYTHIVWVWLST